MPRIEHRTIVIDGITLTLIIERKRVKHINARLRNSTLFVSVPFNATQTTLDVVIPDLARRHVRRERSREINAEDDALALVQRVAQRFPTPPQVVQALYVTTQQTRWGSYSADTQTIRLHAVLRQVPEWVREAIVAHELAHAIYPNHSPDFWALLDSICPKSERALAFLSGVAWLSRNWEGLPSVERALLADVESCVTERDLT